jgi:hypothetical protein
VSTTNLPAIRIVRQGNGKIVVAPSPALLHPGDRFVVKNWTECPADVDFGAAPIDPKAASIPPRPGEATFAVRIDAAANYYEYDVALTCVHGDRRVRLYAEGQSKPSVIVDP